MESEIHRSIVSRDKKHTNFVEVYLFYYFILSLILFFFSMKILK